MDEKDVFVEGWSNVPGLAEELDRAGRTDSAGNVEGKMQIEEFFIGSRSEFRAFLAEGFVPGLIRGQAGGSVFVGLIVASDFSGQKLIGVVVVLDLLISKEGDQALLESAKEPFDFAFGLRGRSDAMVDADGR